MAKYVLLNVGVTVNSVDLSDHADTATLTDSAAKIDATAFGGNGYTAYIQGLKDASVSVDFFSDFAASSVHATLYPLYLSGTTFPLTILPDSTSGVSATNPKGTMLARLYSYAPLTGKVGDVSKFTAEFQNAGSGITWGTS